MLFSHSKWWNTFVRKLFVLKKVSWEAIFINFDEVDSCFRLAQPSFTITPSLCWFSSQLLVRCVILEIWLSPMDHLVVIHNSLIIILFIDNHTLFKLEEQRINYLSYEFFFPKYSNSISLLSHIRLFCDLGKTRDNLLKRSLWSAFIYTSYSLVNILSYKPIIKCSHHN